MFFVLLEVGGADSVVGGTPCYCTELGGSSVSISSPLFTCGSTGCSCIIPVAGNAKTHLTNLTCFLSIECLDPVLSGDVKPLETVVWSDEVGCGVASEIGSVGDTEVQGLNCHYTY